MNAGFWTCIIFAISFLFIGILFAVFKEKTAIFISGFNSLSKEEQALYDRAYISRDMRNQCFIWTAIMFIGAVLSYCISSYMAIFAFIVWLTLFFKDVHFDAYQAFEKYLIK